MTEADRGFLLLCSHLGDFQRKPLTTAQLRTLSDRVRWSDLSREDRDMTDKDLLDLGLSREQAGHILSLLKEGDLLDAYLSRGKGMTPITRADEGYPLLLRQRLGLDSPGCLWAKGDLSILNTPAISLVGSRDLLENNRAFAEQAGREAAAQGLTLVSGNARGADRTAQEACLRAGGRVISVVADELTTKPEVRNLLWISEEDYDAPFSASRALSRNRIIHCLGALVLVAQCSLGQGGTWDGTAKNLRFGWSLVAGYNDGSPAMKELEAMGAYLMEASDLEDLNALSGKNGNFLDR